MLTEELYSRTVDALVFYCSFSYNDNAHCITNYVIAGGDRKLSNGNAWELLHKIYTSKEIEEYGYYLRSRYEYRPFRNGKARVTIYFERELSDMDKSAQRKFIAGHVESFFRRQAVSLSVEYFPPG
ncbi:hypothetical protein [uncultured Alistipes sp.]|uniref:hypothetical protein n=1 Tax=uncultured Alistipes sp. TaxID=538949 RepID=UPI0025F7F939|nr:hypothetical protein [uncultured Alistipes sp.]